jgi:hypothetical protein
LGVKLDWIVVTLLLFTPAAEVRAAAACWFCADPKAVRSAFTFLLNELIEDTAGGGEDDD